MARNLSVTDVAAALHDSVGAVTITEVAARVQNAVAALDASATILFEERLAASGFDWEDDYTDRLWSIGVFAAGSAALTRREPEYRRRVGAGYVGAGYKGVRAGREALQALVHTCPSRPPERVSSMQDETLYEVTEGFPRITPSMVLPAVDHVRYTISLSVCESFRVPTTTLEDAISGEADGP